MAPPQVNLNEKPPAETSEDPLPEKPDAPPSSGAVIVTVDRRRPMISAEQRRQRKRCRIICCASLSFLLVLMLALGTACIVYRMKHKRQREWQAWCGTQEAERLPEHVTVNHEHKLIYVKPEHHDKEGGLFVLHEYSRHLIAFRNSTAKKCYIDRLDETFEDGYARWQSYAEVVHRHNRTVRVFEEKINVEVVKHIADVHIFEHCGKHELEYHWVMTVTREEIREHPQYTYIKV